MNTSEIIKRSVYFPIRHYRGFIKVTLLFFVSEIVSNRVFSSTLGDFYIFYFMGAFLVSIFVLGASTIMVFGIIDKSDDLDGISLAVSTKIGLKDELVEFYYFLLTFIVSLVVSLALGFFHNISNVIDGIFYLDDEMSAMTLPKLFSYLSPDLMSSLSHSVICIIVVFIISYAIFFSLCSIAKVRLKETQDLKESLNFIKMFRIAVEKGFRKYLNFVILNFIIFGIVTALIRSLEIFPIMGSIVSALLESFSLFFILYSYTLFYYS